MPGISIISNFDVNQSVPIDSRLVATSSTERNAIQYKYAGLKVYQVDINRTFTWNGASWDVEGSGIYGGSGSLVSDTLIDFGTVSVPFTDRSEELTFVSTNPSISAPTKNYLVNGFYRHTVEPIGEFRGVEYRHQLKYLNVNGSVVDSAYISFNPKRGGTDTQHGGIAFNTGYSSNVLSEKMRITYSGKVGIGTTDPKEYLQIGTASGNQKPFVIHNSGSAVIGYNWYFSGSTDQYFDVSEGSSKIIQDSGAVTIQTRPANAVATNYTSVVHIGPSGRVGIRTTSPNAVLDVVGNIKASTDIETTDGYFFKNSPNVSIQSLAGNLDLNVNGNVFRSNGIKNLLYLQTELVDCSLLIRNNSFTNFQRYSKGIILEAAYSTVGSGIFHYQGDQANNEMGVSIVDFFTTYTRESIRTSEGGKRVQIGVPSSVTTNHSFSHLNTNNSQIDTKDSMHSVNNTPLGINPVQGANLICSGNFNQLSYQWIGTSSGSAGGTYRVNIYQQWQRVGRVVTVHFQIDPITAWEALDLDIPIPIKNGTEHQGFFVAYSSTSPYPARNGRVSGKPGNGNFVKIFSFSGNTPNLAANYQFYAQVNGSYSYILP